MTQEKQRKLLTSLEGKRVIAYLYVGDRRLAIVRGTLEDLGEAWMVQDESSEVLFSLDIDRIEVSDTTVNIYTK